MMTAQDLQEIRATRTILNRLWTRAELRPQTELERRLTDKWAEVDVVSLLLDEVDELRLELRQIAQVFQSGPIPDGMRTVDLVLKEVSWLVDEIKALKADRLVKEALLRSGGP